jgi:hypothetical protein
MGGGRVTVKHHLCKHLRAQQNCIEIGIRFKLLGRYLTHPRKPRRALFFLSEKFFSTLTSIYYPNQLWLNTWLLLFHAWHDSTNRGMMHHRVGQECLAPYFIATKNESLNKAETRVFQIFRQKITKKAVPSETLESSYYPVESGDM